MDKRKTKSLSKTSKEKIKNYSVIRSALGGYFVTSRLYLYISHCNVIRAGFSSEQEARDFMHILTKLTGK